MYTLYFAKSFKKDFKKIQKNRNFKISKLEFVFSELQTNNVLDTKYKVHKLHGEWNGYYECHIQPDVLLIYEIDEENKLIYINRLGSHSDLF